MARRYDATSPRETLHGLIGYRTGLSSVEEANIPRWTRYRGTGEAEGRHTWELGRPDQPGVRGGRSPSSILQDKWALKHFLSSCQRRRRGQSDPTFRELMQRMRRRRHEHGICTADVHGIESATGCTWWWAVASKGANNVGGNSHLYIEGFQANKTGSLKGHAVFLRDDRFRSSRYLGRAVRHINFDLGA